MRARTQLGRPVGASGEETRRRIIVATMKCVAEVGYAKATIREIARMANVTSASLYNYFPTKSELIKATIASRTDTAMPRLRRAAEGAGDIVDIACVVRVPADDPHGGGRPRRRRGETPLIRQSVESRAKYIAPRLFFLSPIRRRGRGSRRA